MVTLTNLQQQFNAARAARKLAMANFMANKTVANKNAFLTARALQLRANNNIQQYKGIQ